MEPTPLPKPIVAKPVAKPRVTTTTDFVVVDRPRPGRPIPRTRIRKVEIVEESSDEDEEEDEEEEKDESSSSEESEDEDEEEDSSEETDSGSEGSDES